MHLNAAALATDQSRFSEFPEVLRERGLRDRLLADRQKCRTILRTLLPHDVGIDRHTNWIGQSVKDSLDRDVLNGRVE